MAPAMRTLRDIRLFSWVTRVKWWEDPAEATYHQLCATGELDMKDELVSEEKFESKAFYQDAKPIFFGHYWLKGKPELGSPSICCLDFSVAKGGYLTAYRYDGEQSLSADKLVYIKDLKQQ